MQRIALVVSASAALAAGSVGCSSSGSGSPSGAARITTVRGQLGSLAGKNVRVAGVVKGKQYSAKLTQAGKADGAAAGVQFTISNLPEGPKSIVVEIDGHTIAVQFPKSHARSDAFAEMIPETHLASATVDLGDLVFDGDALTCTQNPFDTVLDTDADGIMDFDDDDIDGDGTENWDDESSFGDDEEYADWGWTEAVDDSADADGDGEASWDEEGWSWGDTEEWTVCADDDLACWQAEVCAGAGGAEDPICASTLPNCATNPNDPACQVDPCVADPEDPACEVDPCVANPADPACQADPCEANPAAPECQDPCVTDPESPECDPCAATPDDPECG